MLVWNVSFNVVIQREDAKNVTPKSGGIKSEFSQELLRPRTHSCWDSYRVSGKEERLWLDDIWLGCGWVSIES